MDPKELFPPDSLVQVPSKRKGAVFNDETYALSLSQTKKAHENAADDSYRVQDSGASRTWSTADDYYDSLKDNDDIQKLVDEAPEEDILDLQALKRLVLRFEKALTFNQSMRLKHANNPEKFMLSEADLDDEIKRFMLVATAPEMLQHLVNLNVVPSLLSLLSHDNTDITISALLLFKELTDQDALQGVGVDNDESLSMFLQALLKEQFLQLLVENLNRFDELNEEDRQGVFATLSIIENIVELDADVAILVCKDTMILKWLFSRIAKKNMDVNRLYSSELLAILLQSHEENRVLFAEQDGFDHVLTVLSHYKKRIVADSEEIEFVENMFDSLCSALLPVVGKVRFLKAEGIELMLIMLRERKMARIRALKVLDFALSTADGGPCCRRFIEAFGLKTIFPIFMKKDAVKLKKMKSYSEEDDEEHCISIVVSLFRHLYSDGDFDYLRLVNKFIEDNSEKTLRLLSLREKFVGRIAAFERDVNQYDNEEFYVEKLNIGLFVLQRIDIIICHLIGAVQRVHDVLPELQQKTLMLIESHVRLDDIRRTVEEYAAHLDAENDPLEWNHTQHLLRGL